MGDWAKLKRLVAQVLPIVTAMSASTKIHIDDVRIREIKELVPPAHVLREFPATPKAAETAYEARQAIHRILYGADDHLLVVIRVYFEKPRTTVGWKGLINDPHLDGSFAINEGVRLARQLLWEINELGLPAGTEFLDMITPQYIADLISWGAIGARTTESQVHRELASGLSCPVVFKNGTDGNVRIAVDAIKAAQSPHHFLSVTKAADSAIVSTRGNEDCHVILRGGKGPNYDAASRKQYQLQVEVAQDVAGQLAAGEDRIVGVMVESHLKEGRQDLKPGVALEYGKSITDACIGWEDSLVVLNILAEAVRNRRAKRAAP